MQNFCLTFRDVKKYNEIPKQERMFCFSEYIYANKRLVKH